MHRLGAVVRLQGGQVAQCAYFAHEHDGVVLKPGCAQAVGARFGGVARAVADRAQRRLLFEPAEDVARPEAEQQSAHLGQ